MTTIATRTEVRTYRPHGIGYHHPPLPWLGLLILTSVCLLAFVFGVAYLAGSYLAGA